MNFRISLFIATKKTHCWYFDRNYTKPIDELGKTDIFSESYNPRIQQSLYSFRSLISFISILYFSPYRFSTCFLKLESVLIAQSCLTLCNTMDCSLLPGSPVPCSWNSPGKSTEMSSYSLL